MLRRIVQKLVAAKNSSSTEPGSTGLHVGLLQELQVGPRLKHLGTIGWFSSNLVTNPV